MDFLDIGKVKFSGKTEEKMQKFFQNRVLGNFAEKNILAEAENALVLQNDDDTPIGYWRGEFWGKLIISACRVQRYTGDEKLKETIKNSVYRVLSAARSDGYINSYKNSSNFFPCSEEEAIKEKGWACDWNWNIWCRKYTLWGLFEASQLLEDKNILSAAEKSALQLAEELKNIRISETGTTMFCGLPSLSVLKPILLIYKKTQTKRLLEFAHSIALEMKTGKIPLVTKAVENVPLHEWRDGERFWAKAYELMSCAEGMIEYYRITGEKEYLTAVENIWENIYKYEKNGVCSVGFNDHFSRAGEYMNSLSEPCDVIHWLRITSELYRESGNVKYMHEAEETFFNAFMASLASSGTWAARCIRSSGIHYWGEKQCGYIFNHCCVDNMPRGYINFTETAVCKNGNDVYVNHWCKLFADCGDCTVSISDGYFSGGKVLLTVNSSKDKRLYLRFPKFAGKNANINGEKVLCGEYNSVLVKKGVTELYINFDFSLRLCESTGITDSEKSEDWHTNNWRTEYPDNGKRKVLPLSSMVFYRPIRLFYGPLLLARSKKTGETNIFSQVCKRADDSVCVENIRSDVNSVFMADIVFGKQKVSVIDYSSAGDSMDETDSEYFNIYF